MGDDLGDEWAVEGLDSGDEEISTMVAEAAEPAADQNKKAGKNAKSTGVSSSSNGSAPTALASRKRGRAQLSPAGFEESDGDGDGTGNGGEEEEEDEESRLKAAAEEEAKLRRAEKKKQKLNALKAKMKEKKKQRSAEEAAVATSAAQGGQAGGAKGKGRGAAGTTAGEEAEELWARFCKVRGDLVTPLELDFPWITEGSLARVDGFGAHTAIKLVGFIKASLPDWKKRIKNRNSNAPRGSPSVLIVCAGARRCVEVMKHLTAFRCQVVKLFAKHLRIEEQKVMLRKGCFPIGVGTPGRMRALAAAGSLRLDSSALIVLDLEKNIKGRSVLDMDGVSGDTMAFLAECVRPHLASARSGKMRKGGDGGGGGGGNPGKGAAAEAGGQGQLKVALY